MTGIRNNLRKDYSRAWDELAKKIKEDPGLKQRLQIPDDCFFANGRPIDAKLNAWARGKYTWHHENDMQTMTLVKWDVHTSATHQGGESFARSVVQKLLDDSDPAVKALIKKKEDGLSPELIQLARQKGYIPADYPW